MARSSSKTDTKKKATKKATSAKRQQQQHKHTIRAGSPTAKILNQTARLGLVFQGSPPRNFVARLADYKSEEQAGFKKQLSNLKREGYLDLSCKSTMRLTDKGMDFVSAEFADAPVDAAEFLDRIRDFVTTPKYRQAFDLLADGSTLTRAQLAQKLGYPNANTPGFKKMLSSLKRDAFVEYVGKDSVRLSDDAFPFGRPA